MEDFRITRRRANGRVTETPYGPRFARATTYEERVSVNLDLNNDYGAGRTRGPYGAAIT